MIYAIYDIATTLAAPPIAGWLFVHPSLRPLLGRFRPQVSNAPDRPVCIQACSVGEVAVTCGLVAQTLDRWPTVPVVVTSSTINGQRRIAELLPRTPAAWFPVDQRASVNGFYERLRPRALILVETEIWPNAIRIARRRDIPVLIVNARISDKHYPRYQRLRPLLKPVMRQLSGVAAQNDTYAERFRELGVPAASVRVTGNIKFDGLITGFDAADQQSLRKNAALDGGQPIIIFGSTRPGDEELAARTWATIRAKYPTAQLVVAPRHTERAGDIARVFDEPVRFRSQRPPTGPDSRVLIVDTVGELVSFYALADVAVVGGSFYPGVNGHNPLEPAALGVPTVFGPYMRNFMDPAEALLRYGGALQVTKPDDLTAALHEILDSPERTNKLVAGAREAIAANRGATARTLEFIEPFIHESAPHE
ncbi:MAG: hypothetical protein AMXMBFR82_17560 [Candidatus Hydrogenedentota bacterium]